MIRGALLFGLFSCAAVAAMSAVPTAPLYAQNRDSVATREQLEQDIRRFQGRWREQWIQSMVERGAGIFSWEYVELPDFQFGNYTPNILHRVIQVREKQLDRRGAE